MTTISDGTTTITPELVVGYEATRDARTVVHQVIGRADPDVSLAADGLRTGSLELLFLTEAAASAGLALHTHPARFTLTEAGMTIPTMTYVRYGALRIRLDPQTQELWLLSVGFREVAA